jgi:CRISPR system Cascade subunit CasD
MKYLILKLQGGMQAWGTHTYEDYRPTNLFPTRSGLVGLLGACLGIERQDIKSRQCLNEGLLLAVRADEQQWRPQIITDYHTVLEARKVNGKPRDNAILSSREYICDAQYTIAVGLRNCEIKLGELTKAVRNPFYTPVLGRKSCPLYRPLYETEVEAGSLGEALSLVTPSRGVIYSDEPMDGASILMIRDLPLPSQVREFGRRKVYVLGQGETNVS